MPKTTMPLSQDDVKAFYKEYYQQGGCVIFAAGRLPGNLIEELEKHFGTLPLQSHRAQARIIKHIVEPASQLKNHVVNDAQGVQAAIRIARHFPQQAPSRFSENPRVEQPVRRFLRIEG